MTGIEDLRLLQVEIDGEIDHFRQLKDQAAEAEAHLAGRTPDSYDARSVAMLLTEIYLGAENLMRRIAKRLGEPIPSGGAWHQALLQQFSREAPDLRPPLFASSTAELLDEFRRFRHVTHHAYATHFDWEQMARLRAKASEVLEQMMADAQAFQAFLAEAARRDDD